MFIKADKTTDLILNPKRTFPWFFIHRYFYYVACCVSLNILIFNPAHPSSHIVPEFVGLRRTCNSALFLGKRCFYNKMENFNLSQIDISPFTRRDSQEFVHCVSLRFSQGEPTCKGLGLTQKEMIPLIEHFLAKTENSGLSIVAREKHNGKFVGCIGNQDYFDDTENDFSIINPKWKPNLILARELYSTCLPQLQDTKRGQCMHMFLGAVHEEYMGKGYLLPMLRRSVLEAYKKGYKCAIAEPTNIYAYKAFSKLGFEEKNSIKFDNFYYEEDRPFKELKGNVYAFFKEGLGYLSEE